MNIWAVTVCYDGAYNGALDDALRCSATDAGRRGASVSPQGMDEGAWVHRE
jgi:hypothetical protein